MTIRTVKKDGTGNFTTITTAVAASAADDIIEIQDTGVYNEKFEIFYARMKIRSSNFMSGILDSLPVLDGTAINGSPITSYASGCVYMGLEIRNWGSPASSHLINAGTGAGWNKVLSGCYIHGNNSHGVSAIAGAADNYAVIQDCKIVANAVNGINAGDWLIINNCAIISTASNRHGIIGNGLANATASFCTVDFNANTSSGPIATFGIGLTTGKVINCIVTGTNNGPSTTGLTAIATDTGTYNCVHLYTTIPFANSSFAARALGTGEFVGDPLFVNTSIGDYSLQVTSPCIDTGISYSTIFGTVITDVTGTARPQNLLYDIGAYEYIPLIVVVPAARTTRRRYLMFGRNPKSGAYTKIYPTDRRH